MPGALDLILAAIIGFVYPILDALLVWPRMQRALRSGVPGAREGVFREVIATQWIATAAVALRWGWMHRPWSGLWLGWPSGWPLAAGILIAVLGALLIAQLLRANRHAISRLTDEKRAAVRSRQEGVAPLAPRRGGQRRWFVALSLTAGFCEELLYRGFLVWALRPFLGLWGAALASVVSFAFAHAYQGRARAVGAGVTGAVFGVLALSLGWIVPGMVLHAAIDVMGGEVLYALFREDGAGPSAAVLAEPTVL